MSAIATTGPPAVIFIRQYRCPVTTGAALSHALNPLGGAYFWLAAVGCRVQTPVPVAPKSMAANKAPTVAGTKDTAGREPVAGLLLLVQTLLSANQMLPAVKSIAKANTVPAAGCQSGPFGV